MRTLFLNPPSYDDFDGGAGSRYQAKREVWSFWYPTWLAQPAALVPGSRLVDAPARGLSVADAERILQGLAGKPVNVETMGGYVQFRGYGALAIVFAVNWPPHAPAPGHATFSSSSSSASSIFPTACLPTAS